MRHRILQVLSIVFRWLISSLVRTAITSAVFATTAIVTLKYMGVPLPSPQELIDRFEGLTRLANMLS